MWQGIFGQRVSRELKELYFFTGVFNLATTLIIIFEPVFFYQQGFSLSTIALYYAFHYVLYVLLMPLGAKFAARFGLERSIGVSVPLYILYFLTLAAMSRVPDLFWVAWILLTIHKIFFWPAYHAAHARFGTKGNRGTEASLRFILQLVPGVVGPLLGGVLASRVGFPVLFLASAAVALFAVIPMLRTRERFTPRRLAYAEPWRMIVSRRARRMVISTIGWGEEFVYMVFLPVFLYIVLGGTETVGYVVSLSVLAMSVFALVIGELADRLPRRVIMLIHVPFMALSYLWRLLAVTPVRMFFASGLFLTADLGVKIPWWAQLFREARQRGALTYMTAFEMTLAATKAVLALALAVVFATLLPYPAFIVAFIVAALFALLYPIF